MATDLAKQKPTIFLHVGMAKTGTSALQNFIGDNLERFAENGYYFPETGRVNNCHHGIAFYWDDQESYKKRFDISADQLTRLSDELQAHQYENILISSECLLLGTVNWGEFLSALPHNNIKIIIYFRRQDLFLASRYLELVKGNLIVQPPTEWIKNFSPNEYLGILNRLSEFVGKDNIIVRIYESQQFIGETIFSDFCNILSLPITSDFTFSERNFNPRLSLNAMEFNRLVNTVFDASTPYIFSGVLTEFSLKEKPDNHMAFENHTLFSPHKCHEILDACEEVNKTIAREFLGRENGILFYEPRPALDESWEPYPGLSPEKTEEIIEFVIEKQSALAMRLYQTLTETVSNDQYLQEAKQSILPPLSKCLSLPASLSNENKSFGNN